MVIRKPKERYLAEKAMGSAGWVDVNGVVLRYKLSGAGPTLLMMHELGGTLDSWDYIVPLLEPRFQVLRHDARGAGLSEKPLSQYKMADLSNDAAALLDALHIAGKVVVIGTALGGANALHFAATFPERVAAVVATSPATGVSAAGRQGVIDLAGFLERNGARAIVDRVLDRGYPEALRGDRRRYDTTRARRCTPDPKSFAMAMRVLLDLDLSSNFGSIACPTLLLAGRLDPDRPPEVVKTVADAIAGSTLKVLDSGHFMAIQTPELVAEEINRFLDSHL